MNPVDPSLAYDSKYGRIFHKLKERLELGEREQQLLINAVSALVIRDKLVPPTGMLFSRIEHSNLVGISYDHSDKVHKIHRHALGQLAAKVGFPVTYVNVLQRASDNDWRTDLLAYNLNTLFHNETFKDRAGNPRFLHRIVGDELRGFLSRRFNRHIASAPLLRSYLAACQHVGAVPCESTASDIRLALKCMLPSVFEVTPGQFVCVGVEWANSDFGAGRMQVALSVWIPQGDRFTVLDHVLSRVHIGSVIEDSDIELSDETAQKESEAQSSAIRDAVIGQLAPDSVDRLLNGIRMAHEEEIPWDKLKGQLARYAARADIDNLQQLLDDKSVDLPPISRDGAEIIPTKWWACNALAYLANRTNDPEKKLELQHAAGSFIEVK